ncbi:hypothetical protein BCT17_06715 [Vibrio sp. 10N.222.54.F10]|nr:hypothetical protein BCT17_06715 [Vibrio sp. 10N.222.54.F10]
MVIKIVQKIKNKWRSISLGFENSSKLISLESRFLQNAMSNVDSLITDKNYASSDLIVSLTTYDKRIHDVHLVIESLGYQTNKPNKIVLWLDEDEFTLSTIPILLKRQMSRGLEIRFCKNIRSYKKIVPSLSVFPDDILITVDDDILYPHDFVEQMIAGYRENSSAIIAQRAHRPKICDDRLRPYKYWDFEVSHNNKGLFFTSGAGTLFPPKSLHSDVTDSALFSKLCPYADDVWLNIMAFRNGIEIHKVSDDRDYSSRFTVIQRSQDIALEKINVEMNKNDEQLENILDYYNINKEYIKYLIS